MKRKQIPIAARSHKPSRTSKKKSKARAAHRAKMIAKQKPKHV